MIRKNNRGAGLVTVVSVLAVCGILLAGVMGFAYRQYKIAALSSSMNSGNAEIELCAQLLSKRKSGTNAEDILRAFYGDIQQEEGAYIVVLEDDNSLYLESSKEDADSPEKWTISYRSGSETVVSGEYCYIHNGDGTYTLTETEVSS